MENKTGIYTILNTINNKQYIGSTQMSFKKRWAWHKSMLRANKHKNNYLQNAWNKYGEVNFEFNILEICDKEFCLIQEQKYLDAYNLLYNINPLATGLDKSPKTLKKKSVTMKEGFKSGKYTHGYQKGMTPWNKGHKMSDSHRQILSQAAKGRKLTEEGYIKKQVEWIRRSKIVLQYDLHMNFLQEWQAVREITEALNGYLPQGIRSCCNGHYKCGYYKDYIFKYKHAAPLDSNIQMELDELEGSLSFNDKVISIQAFDTSKEGVTTTGEVESS